MTAKTTTSVIMPRKMPIGIQDFRKLRTEGCVYVDKTEHLYRMVTRRFQVFLSRPCRFGKSLFLTTLKYYFLGRKELFDGLYIGEVEKDWTEYPVFHIELNGVNYSDGIEILRSKLDNILSGFEQEWGIEETDETFGRRLKNVIIRASRQTGRGAVVLIDDYDKPLLDTMYDAALNKQVRDELVGLYNKFKGSDEYLKFVFITGITSFLQGRVTSDFNHFDDISLGYNFSDVCGFTESELLETFKPEIQLFADHKQCSYDEAVAELKKQYGGYNFSGDSEDLYNPYGVLNALNDLTFSRSRDMSDLPAFLIKTLESKRFDLSILDEDISATKDYMFYYHDGRPYPISLLYQCGYLTIKRYDSHYNVYKIGFPNERVKHEVLEQLQSSRKDCSEA
jgi:hypothetical protein